MGRTQNRARIFVASTTAEFGEADWVLRRETNLGCGVVIVAPTCYNGRCGKVAAN
jgi:hypothetical protein